MGCGASIESHNQIISNSANNESKDNSDFNKPKSSSSENLENRGVETRQRSSSRIRSEASQKNRPLRRIEVVVKSTPLSAFQSVRLLSNYLSREYEDYNDLKVMVFLRWMTEHLKHDKKNRKRFESPEEILAYRKISKRGFAIFFKNLCDFASVNCEIIEGYVKDCYFIAEKYQNFYQLWNAVEVQGSFKLVDPMWATGSFPIREVKGKRSVNYPPHFNEYWVFTRPEQFIHTHFPFNTKWQLFPKEKPTWDLKSFLECPFRQGMHYHDLILSTTEPLIETRNEKLRFEIGYPPGIMVDAILWRGNYEYQINDQLEIWNSQKKGVVIANFPEPGYFCLELLSRKKMEPYIVSLVYMLRYMGNVMFG
eukprot:gb/GECH01007150.1/.p1 GENE.gb/GECH01007150.1/~~gb/GECH01007150.1/.p1  ORF type:complete len:366 (+),score=57.76 gb/GECH01007150.1/:1-1098(+)